MAILVRFLKILAFSLLCGIVGPIFIFVYFALGDLGGGMGWMLYSGIGITILTVLIAFVLTIVFTKSADKQKALEANGILALADVIAVAETGMLVNDQPVVRLSLQIQGDGIAPFRADTSARISVLKAPTIAGRKLVVLVEPGTQNFEIDWQRSALLNGQVPATFESSADHRTYDLTGKAEPLFAIMQVLRKYGIGSDGVVDVRSNPAARQEIDAILRKSTSAEAQPGAEKASVSDRLAELDRLKASSLVSETEYASKRAAILADL